MGRWLVAAALAVLASLTLAIPALGLGQSDGAAQLIGMRGLLACGLLVLALLCVLAARGPRRRSAAKPAAAFAAVLVLVALAHVGVLVSRGVGAGEVPTAATAQPGNITVLALNVHSAADADAVIDAVRDSGADVLALSEVASWWRDRIEERLEKAGLDFTMFTGESTGSPARGSVLFVSADLGPYVGVPTPFLGVVRVEAADGAGPPFAVVHPRSLPRIPFLGSSPDRMEDWRSDTAVIAQVAADMPGGVIAGDVNATVDHLPLSGLSGYDDAATIAGIGGFATFPSWLPGLLGASIDHVLVDTSALTVGEAGFLRIAGTDHRALVVRVAPR